MVLRSYITKRKVKVPYPTLNKLEVNEHKEKMDTLRDYEIDPNTSDEALSKIYVENVSSFIGSLSSSGPSSSDLSISIVDLIQNRIREKRMSVDSINDILKRDYEKLVSSINENGEIETEVFKSIEVSLEEESTVVRDIENSSDFVRWIDRVVFAELKNKQELPMLKTFKIGDYNVICDLNEVEHYEYLINHKDFQGEVDITSDVECISIYQLQSIDFKNESKLDTLFYKIYDPNSSDVVDIDSKINSLNGFDVQYKESFTYVDNSNIVDTDVLSKNVNDLFTKLL